MIIRKTKGLIQCTRATKRIFGTPFAREDIIETTDNFFECSEGFFLQEIGRKHSYWETSIIQAIKSGQNAGEIPNVLEMFLDQMYLATGKSPYYFLKLISLTGTFGSTSA